MSISKVVYFGIAISLLNTIPSFAWKNVNVIPFDYNEFGHIILEVTINGDENPLKFIFDTGGANLINVGFREFSNSNIPEINSLRIGDMSISNPSFKKMNLSKRLGGDYITTLAGMIGPKFMEDFVWQIDYQKEIMYVTKDKNRLPLKVSSNQIPFRPSITFRSPSVELIAEEVGTREYIIDTGSPGGIKDYNKPLDKVIKAGKKFEYVVDTVSIRHVGFLKNSEPTVTYGRTVKVINARLGNMLLEETKIRFSNLADVTIGNEFLDDYIVTLDFPSKVIHLDPVSAVPEG